jgi:hypothetical protein
MKHLLSNSRAKAGRACLRLHHMQFTLGYRPVEDAETLAFGSAFHSALEAWWNAAKDGADPSVRLAAAFAQLDGLDPYEHAKARAMLTGYTVRWGDQPYKVLAVEAEFRAPLVNPETGASSRTWEQGGKVDAIVLDESDGQVKLVEHKTSGEDISPGSEYFRRLRMDSQVSTYFDGAKALGFDVAACIYDVIGKPKLRPYQMSAKRKDPETPDEYAKRCAEAIGAEMDKYYQRATVVRLESELEEFRFDVWQTAQILQESMRTGRAPRNPDSCSKWGRACPYLDVCTGCASLEDTTRFRKVDNIHPELTQATPKEEATP